MIVDPTALPAALSAAGDRPGWTYVHNQARRVQVEAVDGKILDAKESSEYGGRAQGEARALDLDTCSLVSSPRASTCKAESFEIGTQSLDSRRITLTPLPLEVQESPTVLDSPTTGVEPSLAAGV